MDEALAELLGDRRTGDMQHDLLQAAREAWRRRWVNTEAGGTVIGALRGPPFAMTLADIQNNTGIPDETARRWTATPDQVRYASEDENDDR